jgi:hypothetical protein
MVLVSIQWCLGLPEWEIMDGDFYLDIDYQIQMHFQKNEIIGIFVNTQEFESVVSSDWK